MHLDALDLALFCSLIGKNIISKTNRFSKSELISKSLKRMPLERTDSKTINKGVTFSGIPAC